MARLTDLTRCASLRPDLNVSSGRGAPRMVTGLASLIHNCQSTPAGEDKGHGECDHQRCLHGKTRLSLAPEPATSRVNRRVDEPPMNAVARVGAGISFAPGMAWEALL
jgi:hypothetical protein